MLAILLGPSGSEGAMYLPGPAGSEVGTHLPGPSGSEGATQEGARPAGVVRAGEIPVLLVPGWSHDHLELAVLRKRMIDAGWGDDRVATMRFQDPVGSNVAHSLEVAYAVEELRRRTGADRVDIIAHSMGGLAVRRYLLFEDGGPRVRRVVFLGTPHRGTVAAHLAWGEGGREMVPGSEFLTQLNARGSVPAGVTAAAVATPIDLRVLPNSSATLPGIRNHEVCCPTHAGLLHDRGTFEWVREFLEAPERTAGGG